MFEPIEVFLSEAVTIWGAGGFAMYGLTAVALVMFGIGMHVHLQLRAKGFHSIPETTWRRWIDRPELRTGTIGRLLDGATVGRTVEETADLCQHQRQIELSPIERDLRILRICVTAAPLVGLLGTVTGMLSTFSALSGGSGGEKTMTLVAGGISEALITTETGLVIALPGLFFHYQLARRYERYKAFLVHLESVCTQSLHWRLRQREDADVRRKAVKTIAGTLLKRLQAEQVAS